MGKRIDHITDQQKEFIAEQKVFFVATAMEQGRINLSPKGMDTLRVLDDNRVIWLNLTGSGNETATHLQHSDRMTLMFCAFEGKPVILRLYGNAKVYHERDPQWHELIYNFPGLAGGRQIIDVNVDLVQTSCGMAVPFMDFKSERTELKAWAEKQGADKLLDYRKQKNTVSLDGLDTGIF